METVVKFDSMDNISYSTPKKSAPKTTINFNDSGIDGRSSDESAMVTTLYIYFHL